MQVEDKLVKLGPGMAVTVEIKTGRRRIISYLLSPLARSRHEALRER
jgi:hemolysin D